MKKIICWIFFTIIGFTLKAQVWPSCSGSLSFDKINSYVKLPDNNQYYSSNGFTWECWFKLNLPIDASHSSILISCIDNVQCEDDFFGFNYQSPTPIDDLIFKIDGPGGCSGANNVFCQYKPSGGFQVGTWYHAAGVMDYTNQIAKLFVNGQLVDSKSNTQPPITRIVPVSLSSSDAPHFLYGNLDEVRIWNKPLTDAEILANYNTCLSGNESNLLIYYRCNEKTGSIVTDASVNHTDSPISDSVEWSNQEPDYVGSNCFIGCPCPPMAVSKDTTICIGSSVTLTASGADTYIWSPSSGLSATTGVSVSAHPSVTTTYTIVGTGSCGTDSTVTTVVVDLACSPVYSCSGSLQFDSLNSGLALPDNNQYYSSNGFTWECWFKLNSAGIADKTKAFVLISQIDYTSWEDIMLGFGWPGYVSEDVLIFKVDGAGGGVGYNANVCQYKPIGGFVVGTWYHAAGVMDYANDVNKLYVNGQLVDSKPNTFQPITRVMPTGLGWDGNKLSPFAPGPALGGNMDEIRFWNSVRTDAEILNNFDKCLQGNEANLLTYYRCNQTAGSTVTDASINHADGVLSKSSLWSTEEPVYDVSSCGNANTNIAVISSSTICSGASTTLTASGANTYTWLPATGLSNTTGASVIATPTVTTTYTITGLGSCDSDTALTVIVVNQNCSTVTPCTLEFIAPDTVCVNQSFSITNMCTNASTYYWNFCSGNVNTTPVATNLGTMGGAFSLPVYGSVQKEGNNYYLFMTNNLPGTLTRLYYGNSLLNTPVVTDLGNLAGILPDYLEAIYIQKEGNNYYGVAVGGWPGGGVPSRMVKFDFGNSLANIPIATNIGNIGGMDYPKELKIFKDGANYYGFTINTVGNTITRFEFGNSIYNTPTGTNFGNLGGLSQVSGISIVNYQNNWYGYMVNLDNNTVSRLDFGNSLLNIPTGINLGDPGGLNGACGISVFTECGGISGLITDNVNNNIVSLNFPNGPTGPLNTVVQGNLANFNYPGSIERIRVKDTLYAFIPNAWNNTISRLAYVSCNNSSIPSSVLQTPPSISYNTPGTYDITLTTDETLITESTICKQVVVLATPTVTVNSTSICLGTSATLTASGADTYSWLPATGLSVTTGASVIATPTVTTTYTITGLGSCDSDTSLTVVVVNQNCSTVTPSCSGSLNLDSTNSSLRFPPNVQYHDANGFTWECWVKLNKPLDLDSNNYESRTMINASDDKCSEDFVLAFGWFDANFEDKLIFRVDNPGFCQPNNITNTYKPAGGFIVGTWYHVAGVMDYVNHVSKLYCNGQLVSSLTNNVLPINRVITTEVGWDDSRGGNKSPANPNQPLAGNVDEVRVWNTVRSDLEILANYNQCLAGTESNLLLYYHLNETSDSIAYDASLNHVNAALSKRAVWSKDEPVYAGTSCSIICPEICGNGIDDNINGSIDEDCPTCPQITICKDTTICLGATVTLTSSGAFSYSWSPSAGLSATSGDIVFATPSVTTTYTVIGTTGLKDQELVLNGDFSQGNTGFTNEYTYLAPQSPGNYFVANDFFISSATPQYPDHSSTSDGLFASFDGKTTTSVVWEQTINTIIPNKKYVFSFWATRGLTGAAEHFEVHFIGDITGDRIVKEEKALEAPAGSFIWDKYSSNTWDSQNNNTLTIRIRNIQTAGAGNDFGLDDISFKELSDCKDTAFVKVFPDQTVCNIASCSLSISHDTTICPGASATLTSSGADTYTWSPSAGLSSTTGAIVVATPSITTTYTVVGTTLGPEQVINGDFSLGNTGYINDYTVSELAYTAGTYFVGNDLYTNNTVPQWTGHTHPVSDMYATYQFANSVSTLWEQTISNLTANFDYQFSFWSSRGAKDPQYKRGHYEVHFLGDVTGDEVVNDFLAIQTVQSTWFWDQSPLVAWNARGNHTVKITIKNLEINGDGNQYGLDDISFRPICIDTAEVNVVLNQTACNIDSCPVIRVNNDTTICPGGSITLTSSGAVSYTWSPITGLSATTGAIVVVTPSLTTTYTVIGANLNCNDTATVKVTIRDLNTKALNLGKDRTRCLSESFTLDAGAGYETYSWQDNSTNQTYTATEVGTYWVTVKKYCKSKLFYDTVSIEQGITPSLDIREDTSICRGEKVKLTFSSDSTFSSYSWTPRIGLSCFDCANPNAKPFGDTRYYLVATTDEGCSNTDSVLIDIIDGDCSCQIYVPNAFTPNKDNLNDMFSAISNCPLAQFSLMVFDRWGEKLFETDKIINSWDGFYQGEICPLDTYVYNLKYQFDGENAKTLIGKVHLIR